MNFKLGKMTFAVLLALMSPLSFASQGNCLASYKALHRQFIRSAAKLESPNQWITYGYFGVGATAVAACLSLVRGSGVARAVCSLVVGGASAASAAAHNREIEQAPQRMSQSMDAFMVFNLYEAVRTKGLNSRVVQDWLSLAELQESEVEGFLSLFTTSLESGSICTLVEATEPTNSNSPSLSQRSRLPNLAQITQWLKAQAKVGQIDGQIQREQKENSAGLELFTPEVMGENFL